MVHRHGLQPGGKAGFQVHQPGAARAAQPFAAWGREHIALQGLHVDGDVAEGLGRIDDVGDAMAGAQLTQGLGVIHRAAVGRHPGQRDELDARVQPGLQRLQVDVAVRGAGYGLHHTAGAGLQLQQHGVVAAPFAWRDQHTVPGLQWQGADHGTPAVGVAGGQGDIGRLAVQQRRQLGIELLQLGLGLLGGHVGAQGLLALHVVGDALQHAVRHQSAGGLVEVVHGGE